MVRIVCRPDQAPKDEEEEVLAAEDEEDEGSEEGDDSDDDSSESAEDDGVEETAGAAAVEGAVDMDIDDGGNPAASDQVTLPLPTAVYGPEKMSWQFSGSGRIEGDASQQSIVLN